jgi:hypothetical protein
MTHAYFRTRNNTSIMRTYFVQGMVKVRKYGMSEGMNTKTSIWAGVMRKLTERFGNVYTCHRRRAFQKHISILALFPGIN